VRFGVIGGSLGGLITAHALRAAGFTAEIYERATGAVKLRGAGMGLQEPLADYIRENSIADPTAMTTKALTRKVFDRVGTLVSEQSFAQSTTSWEALWKAFMRVTPDGTLHRGFTLQSFKDDGFGVALHFENGETRAVDYLVAADGVNSVSRLQLLGREPTYAGYVAWRGVVDEADAPDSAMAMLEDSSAFCQIPHGLFLAYLIPGANASVLRGSRYLNWVWYRPVASGKDLDSVMTDNEGTRREFSVPEGLANESALAELRSAAVADLPPAFAEIFSATRHPFVQPIIDFDLDQMVFGRVSLVGDAAFVIRPHTAASTYKAAIDGITLAQSFGSSAEPEIALVGWEGRQLALGKHLLRSGQAAGKSIMGRV
jgi:2-polyprenyl-6-methoxyphenol hydroxylase-like FAD-dependent oxidoreductase